MTGIKFERRLTANEINKEAIIMLSIVGWKVWRNNQHRVKGRTFKGLLGVSDIIGYTNYGAFVACEGKKDGDELSDDQRKFLSELHISGGMSFVAFQDKEGYFRIMDYFEYLKHEQMHKKKVHKKGGEKGA